MRRRREDEEVVKEKKKRREKDGRRSRGIEETGKGGVRKHGGENGRK